LALAKEFGEERVGRLLEEFRRESAREGASASTGPDWDVLAGVLVAERAAELDVAVASAMAAQVEEVDRTRWGRMLASLPPTLVEGILGVLEEEYGQQSARQVLAQPWSRDWAQWEDLQTDLCDLGVTPGCADALERDEVLKCVQGRLRAHVRLAVQNAAVVARSDGETQMDLRRLGYEPGHGEVWDDSQCLADSLLQLLKEYGVLSGDISEAERKDACAENRRRLNGHGNHALRPRRRCAFTNADLGEDARAYLQHDVHAEPTVEFFLEWFADAEDRGFAGGGDCVDRVLAFRFGDRGAEQ
jgi:hypothetical protein